VKVYVCIHFISYEGEIGEMFVFADEAAADLWISEHPKDEKFLYQTAWREKFEKEVIDVVSAQQNLPVSNVSQTQNPDSNVKPL
jgi:hypothetical protein